MRAHLNSPIRKSLTGCCAATLLVGLGAHARADVSITADVTVTPSIAIGDENATATPITTSLSVLVHGKSARAELPGGFVLIVDGMANKVYTLNTAQKTYSLSAVKKYIDDEAAGAATPGQEIHLDAIINLDRTGITDIMLEHPVVKYTLSGDASIVHEAPASSQSTGRRGGGGRGGRFPGGNVGQQLPAQGQTGRGGPASALEIQVDGDVWTTDAAALPGGVASLLPLIERSAPRSVFRPFYDKLAHLKLVPLSSHITIRHTSHRLGDPGNSTIDMRVKAIAVQDLDAGQFSVPADYVKIDAAAERRQQSLASSSTTSAAPPSPTSR